MTLDATGRTPGRGAYVCRDAVCIATATERGLLARALLSPMPAALAPQLEAAVTMTSTSGGTIGQE